MKKYLKNRDWTLLGIFLAAVVFRILLMMKARWAIGFDEAHYLRLAGSFLEKGIPGLLHPYWPPLYSACIGFVSLFIGNLEMAARILNIILGSSIVFVIYHLTKRFFGRKESILTALLFAFYPPLAFSHTNVMAETLYTFLGLTGILMGIHSFQYQKIKWAVFAGLCWSGCYLVRPEGVGFLFIYMGFLGVWFLWDIFEKRSLRKLVLILVSLFSFLLLAGPYLFYLKQDTGHWTLSTKGEVNQQLEASVVFHESQPVKDPFYHLTADNQFLPYDMAYHFGNLKELASSQEGEKRVVNISLKNYAEKYMRNFYRLIRYAIPETVTVLFLLLFTLGFFTRSYKSDDGPFVFYLGANVVFFWFVLIPLFHLNTRYLMPLFPLVFVWSGPGLIVFFNWLKEIFRHTQWSKGAASLKNKMVLFLTICFLSVTYLPEMGKVLILSKNNPEMWHDPIELKAAGLWLKDQQESPPKLMSLNKAVDFYAGQYDMKQGASFSYDTIDRNVAYALHRKVDYLVMTERYLEWFPNLSPLFEEQPHPQLQKVYERTTAAGLRTVIYRLLPKVRESK